MFVRLLGVFVLVPLVLGQIWPYGEKPGACPPNPNVGICDITCDLDAHCPSVTKCCRSACGGTFCSNPVTPLAATDVDEKLGVCPSPSKLPWVCSSRCANDRDCRREKKCCQNKCGGYACVKPEPDLIIDEDLKNDLNTNYNLLEKLRSRSHEWPGVD